MEQDWSWLGATITALIAVIVALTTAFNGYFNLKLERDRHARETHPKYLDRAVQAGLAKEDRSLVLRFIVSISTEGSLARWANGEIEKIERVEKIQEALLENNRQLHAARLVREADRSEKDKAADIRRSRLVVW